MTNSDPKTIQALDLLWGAEAIAAMIGRSPQQTHNMLVRGILPARKVGAKWCASREALIAFFTQPDQRAA